VQAWRERLDASGIVLASYRGPSMDPRHPASGGLASALGDLVRSVPTTWVVAGDGPGGVSPDGALVRPVALPAHERQLFYGGFSNRFYWMLAHGIMRGYSRLQVRHWFEDGYRPANRRFAETLDDALEEASAAGPEPPVWIHDYHLFLAPGDLRALRPHARIGFFLHVPFPTLAAWHACEGAPVEALVRGLIGADVIGLQTVRDAQRLLAAIDELVPETRVAWAPARRDADTGDGPVPVGAIEIDGRVTTVGAYPISIDVDAVAARARTPRATRWRHQLAAAPGTRTIVRVDRLDPAKNILVGFDAYERVLARRRDLAGQARFLAFLVPSRESLPEYRDFRQRVIAKAVAINGRFAPDAGGHMPITLYLQNNVEAAMAGLSLADVVVINSVADGMNLVAKELTVAGGQPALVLSRLAGVAEAYRDAALLVEPDDVDATARALERALDMPRAERERRFQAMRRTVRGWTLADWMGAVLADLTAVEHEVPEPEDTGLRALTGA